MKNKGFLTLLLTALLVLAVSFGLSKLLYAILTPSSAKTYSLFQTNTIAFHDHYVAVPSGTLLERILTIFMFTLAVWAVLWGFVFIFRQISGKKAGNKAAKYLFYFIALLYTYSVVATNFFPKRLAIFNTDERTLAIVDYQAILYIWPNPIPKERSVITLDEIKELKSSGYTEMVMGAGHEEVELVIETFTGKVQLARAMLHHGEFGWLVDWRSKERVMAEGEAEAARIVNTLNELLGK